MALEILITALIIGAASLILFRSLKNKSKGTCDCGNCSKSCPYYEKEHKNS